MMTEYRSIFKVCTSSLFLVLICFALQGQDNQSTYSQEFSEAREALNEMKWRKGQKLISQLQLSEPRAPHVHATAGRMKLAMGSYKSGKRDIQKALKLDPMSPIALLGLAEVLEYEGKFEESLQMANKAFFYNNEFHLFEPIVRLKCDLHLKNAEYGEAEQLITATIDTDLHKVGLINDLAYIYQKQGQEEKALSVLYDCIDAFGDDVHTLNNIGYVLNLMSQYDLAIKHLERANRKASSNPIVLSNLSISYYLMGDKEKAERFMLKSFAADGGACPVANYMKARLLVDQGKCAEACNICTDMTALDVDRFGNPQLIAVDKTECDCLLSSTE